MKLIKNPTIKRISVVTAILLATIAKLLCIGHVFYVDMVHFHLQWITHIDEYGLLNMYSTGSTVDYPPIFVTLLSLIRKPIMFFYDANYMYLFCLFIKLIPILVNLGFVYFLYKKVDRRLAFLWYINPAFIINSEMMGQTDTILVIIVIAMLYLLIKNKHLQATLMFAFGCLVKLQMFYYLPILIFYLVRLKDVKKALRYFICGIGFGYMMWLPFCISNRDLLLPFKIYLGGFNKYKSYSMNAMNPYIILNGRNYENAQLLGIPVVVINYILIFACIAFAMILLAKNKNINHLFTLVSFYIYFLFYFTLGQHERYTLPCVALFLIGGYAHKYKKSKVLLYSSTILCTFNQLWSIVYDTIYEQDNYFKYNFEIRQILLVISFSAGVVVLVNIIKQIKKPMENK